MTGRGYKGQPVRALALLLAVAAMGATWAGCGGSEQAKQSTNASADKPMQTGKAKSPAKDQSGEAGKRDRQMDEEASGKPKANRQSRTQRSLAPGSDVRDQNSARKAGSTGKAGQGNAAKDLADQTRAARENASGGGSSNQGNAVDDRDEQAGN